MTGWVALVRGMFCVADNGERCYRREGHGGRHVIAGQPHRGQPRSLVALASRLDGEEFQRDWCMAMVWLALDAKAPGIVDRIVQSAGQPDPELYLVLSDMLTEMGFGEQGPCEDAPPFWYVMRMVSKPGRAWQQQCVEREVRLGLRRLARERRERL